MTSGINQYTKNSPVAVSPHPSNDVDKGKSRDIVASKLNFTTGREVDRAITTIDIIDNLEENGGISDGH